jgi:anaerobic selenocysteine-containing dehydrogenase
MDPLPRYDAPEGDRSDPGRYPLTFLSAKSNRYFLNSSHANQPRHLKASGEPRLRIHPKDAALRGIETGDRVRVFNDRGAVEIAASVEDATLESVVTMPHGFWASLLPGGSSANALTSDGLSDLGGGGAIYDARVEVEKLGG